MIETMRIKAEKMFLSVILLSVLPRIATYKTQVQESAENTEEYCILDSFQPRCRENEAILMNSATYGRMRIGRCITAEEVAEFGDDPRYFGCSANVLSILDRKCTGKTECDIRHADISKELSTKPCFPGLNVYLEVDYDCVSVADNDRSCTVTASSVPSHIITSTESSRKCATETQPWSIEAPAGQKIKITLIDFLASQFSQNEEKKMKSCLGVIVDKTAKRNVSICVGGEQRKKYLYSSKAETLEIYYNSQEHEESTDDVGQFALKYEAVGCSDLIPPEEGWLKRSDDSILIGCYSNRHTWELHCEGERWIGVFGNCSQKHSEPLLEEPKFSETKWSDEQILTGVAVGGLTLTVCLAVLCIGILCLRKFSTKSKSSQDYKVLDFQFHSPNDKRGPESMQSSMLPCAINDIQSNNCANDRQVAPTYSVFVGEGSFNGNPNYNESNLLTRA